MSNGPNQHPGAQRLRGQDVDTTIVDVCARCGRDLKAHIFVGRAHVRQPLGSPKYVCPCGQEYSSGKAEWDYLSQWEKRQWISEVGLTILVLIAVAIFAFLTRSAIVHRQTLVLVCLGLALAFSVPLLPLVFAILEVPFEIAASLWRTRVGAKPIQ